MTIGAPESDFSTVKALSLDFLGLTLLTFMLASAIINSVHMAVVFGADYPITAVETSPAFGNYPEDANAECNGFRDHTKQFSPSD